MLLCNFNWLVCFVSGVTAFLEGIDFKFGLFDMVFDAESTVAVHFDVRNSGLL